MKVESTTLSSGPGRSGAGCRGFPARSHPVEEDLLVDASERESGRTPGGDVVAALLVDPPASRRGDDVRASCVIPGWHTTNGVGVQRPPPATRFRSTALPIAQ